MEAKMNANCIEILLQTHYVVLAENYMHRVRTSLLLVNIFALY